MAQNKRREVLWRGKSWQLVVAERLLTDGSTSRSAFIDHPGSVVLVPLRRDNGGLQVLMLRQYRLALGETILELPAGTRLPDESWDTCAQRELREETGHRAARLTALGQLWPAPGVSNEVMAIYLAEGLHLDPLPQDDDEEIEVIPYAFDEAVRLAMNGRILDAKTIVGIVKAAAHLRITL